MPPAEAELSDLDSEFEEVRRFDRVLASASSFNVGRGWYSATGPAGDAASRLLCDSFRDLAVTSPCEEVSLSVPDAVFLWPGLLLPWSVLVVAEASWSEERDSIISLYRDFLLSLPLELLFVVSKRKDL